METKRKSEVVTVRLDPKLKYLAELAAQRQRRPLSGYIEWAIEESLSHVNPAYDTSGSLAPDTFKDAAGELWDVDEPDRFAKLAIRYPDLLGHEEQRLWKVIRECGYLWSGRYDGPNNEWRWDVTEPSLNFERLREKWSTFKNVAAGELDRSSLPSWVRFEPKPESGTTLDDEIPF